jgi:DNA-binding response OmpR family regulator
MQSSILVVDDEDTLRLGMKARLESQGFNVDTAANGEEAMTKLQQADFDLVLLDINMPFVNGIQVLEYITAEHQDTDVIMLTGFSDFSLAMECLKKGAKDYLVKPIDTSELVARLKSFLRARASERAYQELRHFWQSTVLFDLFGSLRSVNFILEHAVDALGDTKHQKDVGLLEYARVLNERVVDVLKNSVKVADLAEGTVIFKQSDTDFATLMGRICDRYEPCFSSRHIKFERTIEKNVPHVKCDADRIEQVINSIFETAIMASVKGDTIHVAVSRTAGSGEKSAQVQCRVTHSGKAFASEEIAQVLSATEKEWKKINDSIAIGTYNLAISRRILEAQGGTLRVEGKPGKPTAVEFTLPLV